MWKGVRGSAGARPVLSGVRHSWDQGSDSLPRSSRRMSGRACPFLLVTYRAGGARSCRSRVRSTLGARRERRSRSTTQAVRRHLESKSAGKRVREGPRKLFGDDGERQRTWTRGSRRGTGSARGHHAGVPGAVPGCGGHARKVKVSVVDAPAATGPLPKIALTKDRIVIGRGAECDVGLASPVISRKHAAIARQGSGLTIEDLGTPNGGVVNGRLVKKQALAKATGSGSGRTC